MPRERGNEVTPTMQPPAQWRWKLDRLRERLRALWRDEQEAEARPRLCPACGTLVGARATKCHECGTNVNFSMAAVSRSMSEVIPQESPVTYALLGANFMLFVVCLAATAKVSGSFSLLGGMDGGVLMRLGARSTYYILQGEVWRLVMAMFLHGSLLHIGMNMFVLKDLGPQLEDVYGSARFLFLYAATGIVGFCWTTLWDWVTLARQLSPTSDVFREYLQVFPPSVGASGALMGLLGLAIAITTVRGGAYMQMLRGQLLRSFGFILVMGLIIPGIDNAAHIGGFASGFLLGRVFSDRAPMNSTERQRAYALGWVAAVVLAASFGATIYTFFATQP
jgi:rhomboid protease GluP